MKKFGSHPPFIRPGSGFWNKLVFHTFFHSYPVVAFYKKQVFHARLSRKKAWILLFPAFPRLVFDQSWRGFGEIVLNHLSSGRISVVVFTKDRYPTLLFKNQKSGIHINRFSHAFFQRIDGWFLQKPALPTLLPVHRGVDSATTCFFRSRRI